MASGAVADLLPTLVRCPARSAPPQATTNALLSHFFSLVSSLHLLRTIANRPSPAHMMATGGGSSSPKPAAA